MRVLVLWFPRLAAQLAAAARPELRERPFVLLTGAGDEALVAACSAAASASGVLAGMTAGQARSRCPRAAFLPDNAGACLDELDRIAGIVRARATTLVAVESRSHLAVDITALAGTSQAEALLARRLAGYASAWSGLEVRAAVASGRAEALDAARASRGAPVICPAGPEDDASISPFQPDAAVSGQWAQARPAGALEAQVALRRLFGRFEAVLQGRAEGARKVQLELSWADETRTLTLRPTAPLHTASEMLSLVGGGAPVAALEGLVACQVTLTRLGPDVRTRPCAASAAGRGRPGIQVNVVREPLRRAS